MKLVSLILMSLLYVGAGINHLIQPETYLRIMPPYLPEPLFLVYASGIIEIALGLMLWVYGLRRWAAWGIILLLVAVFPANIYMAELGGEAFGLPEWVVIARLPLQGLLIYWAYWWSTVGMRRDP